MGFNIEGLYGTAGLPPCQSVNVHLYVTGHPDHGVTLQYTKWEGRIQKQESVTADRLSSKPVNAMSNFKMEFYLQPRGLEVTFDCKTEENYPMIKAFLLEQLGLPASPDEPDRTDPIFYYIETEQQKETLFSFLGTLR